jgi:3-oxoadipate enol-lactonase
VPYVTAAGAPRLWFELDDHTDPWKNAPYLLLQHGYGRNAVFWYSWVPWLSRYFRVIRPDMRGFGRSRVDVGREGFVLDDLVADVIAVADAAGAARFHYCGEAFGGTLGLQLAAQHPSRVRTLSLVSAPVFLSQKIQQNYALGGASWVDALREKGVRQWVAETNGIARFPPHASPEFLNWYADELGKTDPETLIAFSRLCASYNMTDFLPRIEADVLGLYPTSRPEQVALLRAHLRRFHCVEFPTEYLMLYNMYPRACAEAVLHFAAQFDGTPCTE